jgi:hypothetical protein
MWWFWTPSPHIRETTGIGNPAPICRRDFTRKSQDLPSSRETSIVHLLLFFDPGQIDFSDHYEKSMSFPAHENWKLRQWENFRGSIAVLLDLLFTLHREDYSLPMQNSLPVVGQTVPGRLVLQGFCKGFVWLDFMSFFPPFSKLLGAIIFVLL